MCKNNNADAFGNLSKEHYSTIFLKMQYFLETFPEKMSNLFLLMYWYLFIIQVSTREYVLFRVLPKCGFDAQSSKFVWVPFLRR